MQASCLPELYGTVGLQLQKVAGGWTRSAQLAIGGIMTSDRSVLRIRAEHEHSRVTFVELFFDLIFVFAITQLSHSLLEHFTPLGAVQTLLLLLAVWCVWVYTTWATNWLDPEKLPVRLLLFALMLAGLLMSASIPKAFAARGLAFAAAYASMQVGRTAFVLWAFQNHPAQRRNFQRILVWLMLSALFWLAGGLAYGSARLGFWALALLLEYLSPWVAFWVPGLGRSATSDWNVEGEHMAERCGLFIIIALGESILVTGATFSTLAWTAATVAAFVTSFVGSLALWWLYFNISARAGSETISASTDPGRLARSAYTYVHLLMVAGIILAAVADELVLVHPTGHTDLKTMLMVLGGPLLFLIGIALFKWTLAGVLVMSHLAGIAGLTLLILVAGAVSPLALAAAATLVLVVIAAWETRAKRRRLESHLVRSGIQQG
jgi:low temperature requirement protein LtrA